MPRLRARPVKPPYRSSMAAKTEKKLNMEQAFGELEAITEWFEKEDIDLEEGLAKFERGLEIARKLKQRLGEVENRVEEIKAKFADVVNEAEEET